MSGISIISAPHNMGTDTLFVQLSSLLTEIWPTNDFSVMAALICIKMVRGTFCQLVNIANRFLRIFSNLETSNRFIFPGGAGYPYLPTQLECITINKHLRPDNTLQSVSTLGTICSPEHTVCLNDYAYKKVRRLRAIRVFNYEVIHRL